MRRILLISFIFQILACTSKKEVKQIKNDNTSPTPNELKENKLVIKNLPFSKKDIEFIKLNSKPWSKRFMINDSIIGDTIPTVFLKKHILPNQVNYPSESDSLIFTYSNAYRFCEYEEFKNYHFFTISFDDESCCRHIYGITLSKYAREILNIAHLGFVGGDGGWIANSKGNWENQILSTTEIHFYDADFDESTNNAETDTIWTQLKLDSTGYFKEIFRKRVSYDGDKKVEVNEF